MVCSVYTGAVFGVGGYPVLLEVDMSDGLPCMDMVGSLGSEVKETVERVRVSLKNMGYRLPAKRFTINLSPAGIRKGGVAFDVPVAIGVLMCMDVIAESGKKVLALGELGLDGSVRPVAGVLPIVLAAKEAGICDFIVPHMNLGECAFVKDVRILGVKHFYEVIAYYEHPEQELASAGEKEENGDVGQRGEAPVTDFRDIVGQTVAKRAAIIAAAGFHNLLFTGPPGTGKTMLASALAGILPPMGEKEMLEVSKVYSVAGLLNKDKPLIWERPFVNPHHTVTAQALTGGGVIPRPGLISMANHGVLFLDELPEFKRQTLDMLRQPMEEGKIVIARKSGSYVFPSNFMLVAAMNPCPCGYYPDTNRCMCSAKEVASYRKRVSGPLFNRMDLCVNVGRQPCAEITGKREKEGSADIRKRVTEARKRQEERNGKAVFNARISAGEMNELCKLTGGAKKTADMYAERQELSLRGYHRLLRVARTIADLEDEACVREEQVLEAASYRGLLDK